MTMNGLFWSHLLGYNGHRLLLKELIKKGRMPLVLLFSGREGLGKKHFALNVAALHFCSNQDACGVCYDCERIQRNQHSSLLSITGANGVIKSDQLKGVEEHLFVAGSETDPLLGKRVCIINDIDQLTLSAVNRLLKLLESTPSHSFVIFTTSRKKAIASTLLSRAVNWHVAPPKKSECLLFLKERLPELEDSNFIEQALIEARGAPGIVLRQVNNTESHDRKKNLSLFLNILENPKSAQTLIQLEEWKQNGKMTIMEFMLQVEIALNKQYKEWCLKGRKSDDIFLKISNRRSALARIRKTIAKQNIALNEYFAAQYIFLSESNFF